MMKNKIIDIISMLCQVTKSSEMVWVEVISSTTGKRSYHRDMYSIGEDGTRFEMEVKFILSNEKWNIDAAPAMWIRNKDLPGGAYYVYGYKEVLGLRDLVLSKYCADLDPKIEDVESKLDNIFRGISVSTNRDNKLNEIL